MGVVSLVFGIISLVCCLIPLYGSGFGILFGVIGIVFGAIGRKNPDKRGIATTGLVLSIIGCTVSTIVLFAVGTAGACVSCI